MPLENYQLTVYTPSDKLTAPQIEKLTDFLHTHLQQYGDSKASITKAIRYAMQDITSPGGHVFQLADGDKIIGAVVVNQTGMQGYIPENILVYIAVHEDYRGQGIGKHLMKNTIRQTDGDIALHVEPDNPAKRLYEKLGFENKYLEMRLKTA